nr:threonine--tRNA ligase [Candidatus Saccharibacteria bacterium]
MIKPEQNDLYAMRHSLAHIMATATISLWPEAKLGVGPVVDNGFYYDIDIPGVTISESDFKQIEKVMRQTINQKQDFVKTQLPIDDAIAWAKENNQPYKTELLNDLKRAGTTVASNIEQEDLGTVTDGVSALDNVSFYTNGNFTDLCRGPHVGNTANVGAFKLMRVAGAYWRGKEGNPQMQRLYGVAFATNEDLDLHLKMLEEAKRRDHRKLGQELDLFVSSSLVGPGLPLFTPRGTILRNKLIELTESYQKSVGYEAVWVPHMAKIELYKKSGHYDKYPERFDVSSGESDDKFMMKPMNCPHVTQIYASRARSYRDLPLRYMETTTMYRDEKSGELHGLSRVRALTQDDSHSFCRRDQIESEMESLIAIIKEVYEILGLDMSVELSFRDESDGYLGDDAVWQESEKSLVDIANKLNLDYVIEKGEAAFYGPKIDIHISDGLGRQWQTATVQLDFIQPDRFELEYTNQDGEKETPVMIHKTILGSIERFLSVYIEHRAGKFPFWLAPEQIRVLTINDDVK